MTAMLWGSMLAFLIDQRPRLAALCALVSSFLTLFGLIHSLLPTGEIYLPWAVAFHGHYIIALAYLLLSGVFLFLKSEVRE